MNEYAPKEPNRTRPHGPRARLQQGLTCRGAGPGLGPEVGCPSPGSPPGPHGRPRPCSQAARLGTRAHLVFCAAAAESVSACPGPVQGFLASFCLCDPPCLCRSVSLGSGGGFHSPLFPGAFPGNRICSQIAGAQNIVLNFYGFILTKLKFLTTC